jgi:hypothetical protein
MKTMYTGSMVICLHFSAKLQMPMTPRLKTGQILALLNKLLEIATRRALKKSGIRWYPLGMKGHSMISLRRLMRSENCHSITAKSLAK